MASAVSSFTLVADCRGKEGHNGFEGL